MKSKRHEVSTLVINIIVVIIITAAQRLRACGPDFPNTLLDGGDHALLAAPVALFELELERMKLARPASPPNRRTNRITPRKPWPPNYQTWNQP